MTIVAGFNFQDGAVLCADSIQNTEDSKWLVRKLARFRGARCQALCGGAGPGDLVECVMQHLAEALDECDDTLKNCKKSIEKVLQSFHRNEVRLHPWPRRDKHVQLLLAVRPQSDSHVTLLKADGPALLEVLDYDIIGVGEVIRYVAGNLYKGDLSLRAGVLLATHLVSLAKKHVRDVEGETTVFVLRSDGAIGTERKKDIERKEWFFDRLNELLKEMVLSSADSGVTEKVFLAKLDVFIDGIGKLRRQYLADVAKSDILWALTNPESYQAHPYFQFETGQDLPLDQNGWQEIMETQRRQLDDAQQHSEKNSRGE